MEYEVPNYTLFILLISACVCVVSTYVLVHYDTGLTKDKLIHKDIKDSDTWEAILCCTLLLIYIILISIWNIILRHNFFM